MSQPFPKSPRPAGSEPRGASDPPVPASGKETAPEAGRQLNQAQRLEAIGQLAGGVAHDFNNLLTIINTNSELLAWSINDNDPRRPLVSEIEAAARSGAQLVRGLLGFVREADPVMVQVGLRGTLAHSVGMLRRILPATIEVAANLPEEELVVRADPAAVQQIILNLGTNARDSMPSGGRLSFELSPVDGETAVAIVPALEGRPLARISVRDTGHGMDESTLKRIFEPFFTTKSGDRGTGLGLSMVKELVEKHGGAVRVESQIGRGTSFDIYLPAEPVSQVQTPEGRRGPIPAGTETILLVDDNLPLQSACRRALEKLGYTVITASDGEAALSALRGNSGRVDLILSDLIMPRMGGFELYDAVLGSRYPVSFLLTSGHTEQQLREIRPLPQGLRVVQKPWTLAELAWAVRDAIAHQPPKPE